MNQSPPPASSTASSPRPGILKSLYLWVLHWADTPYGTPALFLIAFAESSFFPIPPDVLQIPLSFSKPRRSFYYATVSGVGSVLGGLFGYFLGFALWFALEGFFTTCVPGCSRENIEYISAMYQENAFLAILGAAFTPIPYKVFTIAAGICRVPLWKLIVASALGRFGRFYVVAACIHFFGPRVKTLLDKYFEIATLIFFVLVVVGFLAIQWLL